MATITTLNTTDSGATSRVTINDNFTNLNTDKLESATVATLTNKTITLGSNTISGTTAEFNAANTDGDFATQAGVETLSNKTLSGATQLAENASIRLDAALSADGTFSGVTRAGTAGTTLAFGDLVYLAASDSRWELADADAASTSDRLLGMCVLAAAADGDPTVILLMGNIRADTAFPTMTIGSALYVGETAGDVQVAIPTGADNVIRRVGYALTADELYFNPSMDSQITVA
jgi:hypothetical protein